MFERLKKTAARLKVTVRSKTYIVIVAAVLILLNTYPLVVSEKLAYQSKQASMLNKASVLASALATGPEALTAEGATRTV